MFRTSRMSTLTLAVGLASACVCTAALAQASRRPDAQPDSKPAPGPILADIMIPMPGGGAWRPDIPAGFKLIDGDIIVPLSFNPEIDGAYGGNLWTGGVVPYTFDTAFSQSEANQIVAAMNTWSARAGITFVVRSNQANYVYIQRSNANSSQVGMVGGQQIIYFAPGQSSRVYVHELGHCIGFFHEHQRGDRGGYISVNQANVQPAYWSDNFPPDAGTYWGPYDFASIMHYDRCAFSIGCPTGFTCNCASSQEVMTALPAYFTQWNNVMGNATGQSYLDGMTARGLYPFANDRWLRVGEPSPFTNGSFQFPYNTIYEAIPATPINGTLFVDPGTYPVVVPQVPLSRPMTIRATFGEVVITQ